MVVGGRYGLGSKDFTPAMAKAVFDNLLADMPRDRFTVGITGKCHYMQGPAILESNCSSRCSTSATGTASCSWRKALKQSGNGTQAVAKPLPRLL
jgi:hypothetical protein